MKVWKDYFSDVCNACEVDLTEEGLVYVIRDSIGICATCYDTIKIYLIDEIVKELEIKK